MSNKRPPNPTLIPNPFVKKRNRQWTLTTPQEPDNPSPPPPPATSAVESGSAQVEDHLSYFSDRLAAHVLSSQPPPLSISSYAALFAANAGNPNGAHFVIHQHDHPVAGTHYDLRLQINENSSVSWAVMYGLPGDPNSVRLNRNATETRIHCLWNHLIETASSQTGSLLIWDTGTYSVLPRRSKHAPSLDPSSPESSPPQSPRHPAEAPNATPQALLHAAFQDRKIRLRLHGSRLPDPYVLNLRLTKPEDAAGRALHTAPRKKRRRRRRLGGHKVPTAPETSDESDRDQGDSDEDESVPASVNDTTPPTTLSAMEREIQELEDEQVRKTNAYPGASNSIGSVHQRRWYLSLDRRACGFTKTRTNGRTAWVYDEAHDSTRRAASPEDTEAELDHQHDQGRLSIPFYVRGPQYERSVVTGRRGVDILRDERVERFVSRKGWTPVLN